MKILNKPSATKEQVFAWLDEKHAHPLSKAMIDLFFEIAEKENVDPIVVIAQAMKETGYFKFKGVLRPNFCNTCGLKKTGGGGDTDPTAHCRFDYWEDGILAHVQHIALYAGAIGYPKSNPLDPRHFAYLHGKCPNVEDLSGNWAPSKTYGEDIVKMCKSIASIEPKKNVDVEEYEKKIEKMTTEIDELEKQVIVLQKNNDKYMNLKSAIKDLLE